MAVRTAKIEKNKRNKSLDIFWNFLPPYCIRRLISPFWVKKGEAER